MAKAVRGLKRGRRAAEPRREPQQERGERRVGGLLDAAEAVIAEVGVAAATTNAIAERARASVGSLYHFYPNKDALIRALAGRYVAELSRIKSISLTGRAEVVPLRQMVDGIVDPLVGFMQAHPAYLAVYHATADSRHPSCIDEELHGHIVGLVESLMAVRTPTTEPKYRRLQATFAVEFVHRMMEAAWSQTGELRDEMVREMKRVFLLHCEMIERGRDPLA